MKMNDLLELGEMSSAPFLVRREASFARSAQNALEISESIRLK